MTSLRLLKNRAGGNRCLEALLLQCLLDEYLMVTLFDQPCVTGVLGDRVVSGGTSCFRRVNQDVQLSSVCVFSTLSSYIIWPFANFSCLLYWVQPPSRMSSGSKHMTIMVLLHSGTNKSSAVFSSKCQQPGT